MNSRLSHPGLLFFFAFFAASSPRLFSEEPLRYGDGGAQLYSIGQPTAEEQLYLEYINRARANPTAEGVRLAATTDANVRAAYLTFGVNLTLMQAQLAAILPQPPLSMNATLTSIARAHSQDMLANGFQGHNGSNGSSTQSRIIGSGYTANAGYFFGENVFAHASSVPYGHASFEVDWGGTAATGGMQASPGHRENNHSANFREVGIGVVLGSNQGFGPQLVTQDFGSRSDALPLVTGVVYRDANSNGFYDIGEGLSGVTVTIAGSEYYAVSAGSGGYSVPVPQNGIYTVTFSGGSASSATRTVAVTGGQNVKLDYLPAGALTKGDFNGDGFADFIWQNVVSGERVIWFLNNGQYLSHVALQAVGTEWRIAGAADFNNDGHSDLVWRNVQNGDRAIWMLRNGQLQSGMSLQRVSGEWQIAGAADCNADGHADLVWQNVQTGQRAVWFLRDGQFQSAVLLSSVGVDWQIAGAGDFNNDGHADLAWQNINSGARAVWFLRNGAFQSGSALPTVPADWHIAAAADYNGDGHADLAWQNVNSGARVIWFLRNGVHQSDTSLPTIDRSWDIAGH